MGRTTTIELVSIPLFSRLPQFDTEDQTVCFHATLAASHGSRICLAFDQDDVLQAL
jgi:hypothetical protein